MFLRPRPYLNKLPLKSRKSRFPSYRRAVMGSNELPESLALLPLRGRVLLPSSVLRVVVTSPRSLALVDALMRSSLPLDGQWLGLAPVCEALSPDDADTLPLGDGTRVYSVGCAARVLQISRTATSTSSKRCVRQTLALWSWDRLRTERLRSVFAILLEGRLRFTATGVESGGPFFVATGVTSLEPALPFALVRGVLRRDSFNLHLQPLTPVRASAPPSRRTATPRRSCPPSAQPPRRSSPGWTASKARGHAWKPS